ARYRSRAATLLRRHELKGSHLGPRGRRGSARGIGVWDNAGPWRRAGPWWWPDRRNGLGHDTDDTDDADDTDDRGDQDADQRTAVEGAGGHHSEWSAAEEAHRQGPDRRHRRDRQEGRPADGQLRWQALLQRQDLRRVLEGHARPGIRALCAR